MIIIVTYTFLSTVICISPYIQECKDVLVVMVTGVDGWSLAIYFLNGASG